jgi:hypothetical protein
MVNEFDTKILILHTSRMILLNALLASKILYRTSHIKLSLLSLSLVKKPH